MLYKFFLWIKNKFSGSKKTKAAFDNDNPFLIL